MTEKTIEKVAEQLHKWYLEATKLLNPENYNSKAQKQYVNLNKEQKFIDRYIAERVNEKIKEERQRTLADVEKEINGLQKCADAMEERKEFYKNVKAGYDRALRLVNEILDKLEKKNDKQS